jgi:hypothetical protein
MAQRDADKPLAAAAADLAASVDLAIAALRRAQADLVRFAAVLRAREEPAVMAEAPARPPADRP